MRAATYHTSEARLQSLLLRLVCLRMTLFQLMPFSETSCDFGLVQDDLLNTDIIQSSLSAMLRLERGMTYHFMKRVMTYCWTCLPSMPLLREAAVVIRQTCATLSYKADALQSEDCIFKTRALRAPRYCLGG